MNLDKLKGHIPDIVIAQIPIVMEKYAINTPLRLGHFLSQCSHESWNFTATKENLNYSADALLKTFHTYFPDLDTATKYARQPERIGNKVYADRMGNGNEASGDGYKYRGRGYIQLTGKVNYISFDKVVDENILENPDLVATKYPLLSAGWFWNSRNLNALADKGNTDGVVLVITKVINGGYNGLDERLAAFKKVYPLLGD
jgi:putative chitinase